MGSELVICKNTRFQLISSIPGSIFIGNHVSAFWLGYEKYKMLSVRQPPDENNFQHDSGKYVLIIIESSIKYHAKTHNVQNHDKIIRVMVVRGC
jgi:hypothetical protein